MARTPPAPPANPVEAYEQIMVRYVFRLVAEETVRITSPKASDRVLDVATGTGIILRQVALALGKPERLAAVDISPAMIAKGRSIAESKGLSIEWHEGSADQLPYPDGSFDWVYCQHGLQFFPDRVMALREIRRVLNSDGRAAISVWQGLDRHPYFQALDGIAFARAGIHMFQEPFALHDQDMLGQLLEEAGFREITIEPVSITMQAPDPLRIARTQLVSATNVFPSLREMDEASKSELVEGIMSAALPTIDSFTRDGNLKFDWHANLAIARK